MNMIKTDSGNASIFAEVYGKYVRYDLTSGRWLAWDGKRWSREAGENQAQALSRGVALVWFKEMGECTDKGDRKDAFQHWEYTSSAAGVRNMLFLAKSEPGIAVSAKDLDTHPYLLNVLDGTIDLTTGVMRKHDPNDLMTQLAKVTYGECTNPPGIEMWTKCLETWHPAGGVDGTWDYLQELMGYCLTGNTSSRCFPIFWGNGKNGKNVFLDTFLMMLGDYAALAPRTLIEASGREEHPAEIADLMGKRLVLASEPKKGSKLKTSLVKAMTGDCRMKARFMRQDFFEFTPTHKVVMMTQNLPVVDETTDAIWDRLHKVRWGVKIPKEEQDPGLTAKLRGEWPAILKWAIEGCLRWQKKGILFPTEKIEKDTLEYRVEQNPAAKFVETSLILGKGMFLLGGTLTTLLTQWQEFAEDPELLTKIDVTACLKEKGCVYGVKKMGGILQRGWHGVGLRAE